MAVDPWDIKTDDSRQEDTVNVFVIFCEDAVSEPSYFNSFATDQLRINARGNYRSARLNLGATVKDCLEDGYMEFTSAGYQLKNMVTENLWCVYDRDLENSDLTMITEENNLQWSLAIQTAQKAGLKLAWSNDAFELWILLHFEDIDPNTAQHRDYIYNRLTEVFKTMADASDTLKSFTAYEHFNYKGGMKRKSTFEEFVLPQLKSRTEIAIERAKNLADKFGDAMPYHQRNPCTQVYLLVQDLLANG